MPSEDTSDSNTILSTLSDWRAIVDEKLLYIDKTEAIKTLETYGNFCKLWRPRCSGKSLFCQQLAMYYDVAVNNEQVPHLFSIIMMPERCVLNLNSYCSTVQTKYPHLIVFLIELFGHTYIGKHPTGKRGKYYTLLFRFSEVYTLGDLRENFRNVVNVEVMDFIQRYPELGQSIIVNPDDHVATLKSLFKAIQRARNGKLYVIIDDYDAFYNKLLLSSGGGRDRDTTSVASVTTLGNGGFGEAAALMPNFGNVLKAAAESGAIGHIFVTGVAPIALAESFSPSNIFDDLSEEPSFETTFGFTASEVKKSLESIRPHDAAMMLNETLLEMKLHIGGYRFNKEQRESVFNPQMCLYYLRSLQQQGRPPEPLSDGNLSRERFADFLMKNFRSKKPFNPFIFITGLFDVQIFRSLFRSKELFDDERSINRALVSLAYYHGLLTYADPAVEELKGKPVAPNVVAKSLYLTDLTYSAVKRLAELFVSPDRDAQLAALENLEKVGEDTEIKDMISSAREVLLPADTRSTGTTKRSS